MKQINLMIPIFLLLFSAQTLAQDWPQFRGPNRDGISHETGLLQSWPGGGPPLLCLNSIDLDTGYSSPAVGYRRLYCNDEKSGELALVTVGPEFEVVGSLQVEKSEDRMFWAHASISNRRLYVRCGGIEIENEN